MFKMGPYETYEAKGTITIDSERDDVIGNAADPAAIGEYLDEQLDKMFAKDLADVKAATDNEDSFVHFYPATDN